MKTYKEIQEEYFDEYGTGINSDNMICDHHAEAIAKRYALEVAKEVINRIADDAQPITDFNPLVGFSDKEQILNTPIFTP